MKKTILFCLFLTLCHASVLYAETAPPAKPSGTKTKLKIMPLKDVKAGMKGKGLTVFRGDTISEFPVEVMGIIPGGGPGGCDMILVSVSGPVLKKNGGVSMGMSGSPIYISNKLVGALSMTFTESSHMLAGVTPIEAMLAEYRYFDAPAKARIDPPIKIGDKVFSSIDYKNGGAEEGVLHARSAVSPIALRGVTKRSYSIMKSLFASSGIEVLPYFGASSMPSIEAGPSTSPTKTPKKTEPIKPLKPGSAVAVQLVRGDLDISAVGTLTAIDGDRVLIFGHPFFTKGNVNFLLADASVIAIVDDRTAPYKLSVTGAKRGTIYQDRGAALVGVLNKLPEMVPMKVTVVDKDINKSREFVVDIVRDSDLLPNLVVATMLNALDRSIDRIGPGTAAIRFSLKTKNLGTKIDRKNTFYSSTDISAETLPELMMALEMIRNNYFKEVEVTGIDAQVEVDSSQSTATIMEAELVDSGKAPEKQQEIKEENNTETSSDENNADGESVKEAGDNADTTATDTIENDNSGGRIEDNPTDNAAVEDNDNPDNSDVSGDDSGSAPDDNGGDTPIDKTLKEKDKKSKDETGEAGKGSKTKETKTSKKPRNVYPGQKLCLKVTIMPYKKQTVEEKLYVKVPKDIAPGNAVIDVYSGMKYQRTIGGLEEMVNILSEAMKSRDQGTSDLQGEDKKGKKKTLEDLFKQFLDHDKNNELVATVTSLSAAPTDEDNSSSSGSDQLDGGGGQGNDTLSDEEEPPIKDRAKKTTGWVLTGSTSLKVKVESRNGDKEDIKSGKIEKSKITTLKQNGGAADKTEKKDEKKIEEKKKENKDGRKGKKQ